MLHATREDGEPTVMLAVASADADPVFSLLSTEFAPELSKGTIKDIKRTDKLATVAVVGEGMRERTRLAPRILNTLHRDSINVASHTHKASATTLSFVIEEEAVSRTLQLLHALMF